jgi:hypothetical protein
MASAYCFHHSYDSWLTERFVGSKPVQDLTLWNLLASFNEAREYRLVNHSIPMDLSITRPHYF